jgi:hypothetical protein
MTAEEMYSKILELQEEVARLRADARLHLDRADCLVQLQNTVNRKTRQLAEVREELASQHRKQVHAIYRAEEMDRLRNTIASLFDLGKGDGWNAYRRTDRDREMQDMYSKWNGTP